jgi:DNA-binding transcriptional LysR family regulator
MEAFEELVRELKRGAETTLSIVVDVLFPSASLLAFAQEFAREHPSVELLLFSDVLSAVTAHVREKQSTSGVAIEDADFEGLERRFIADVRLLPVAARTHSLALRKGPIDSAGLAEAVQIVLSEHRRQAPGSSGDRGVSSPRTWRIADLSAKQALIEGGLGWGHLPEHLVREQLRTGQLVELELEAWGAAPPRRSLFLVWRTGAVLGPVAHWAQRRLAELCQDAVAPEAHHVE